MKNLIFLLMVLQVLFCKASSSLASFGQIQQAYSLLKQRNSASYQSSEIDPIIKNLIMITFQYSKRCQAVEERVQKLEQDNQKLTQDNGYWYKKLQEEQHSVAMKVESASRKVAGKEAEIDILIAEIKRLKRLLNRE